MMWKLIGYVVAGFAGYEGYLWWKKKNSFTLMQAGHGYTVVLDYSGKGVGGPLSPIEVQEYLSSASVPMVVASTNTDPSKKTITYNGLVTSTFNGTQAMLGPSTFPSAFGRLSVALVQDTGSAPV